MNRIFKNVKKISDSIWEIPIFYKLLQSTLARGGHRVIKKFLIKQIPKKAKKILDQGCGTGEYSKLFKKGYVGIDSNPADIEYAKKKYTGEFLVGNATNMSSLKSESFDVVFAVGLHHHLPDSLAKKAFTESIRVTKKNGKIIVIDAMLPKNRLNLIGLFLRKMDRGGNVRKPQETLNLLPKNINYKSKVLSSFPFDYIGIIITKN